MVHELIDIQGSPTPSSVIPTSRKTSKSGRKLAWMSKELLTELRDKKDVYKRWKMGQVTQENTEILSNCAGMGLGKPRPTWR